MEQATFDISSASLRAICLAHGVRELAVFGSQAQGSANPESDIDLLVEFSPDKEIGYIEFFAMRRELSALFGKKVDLVSKRGLKKTMRLPVLAEAKVIYAS